jgi:lysophospholipase L1-like esterase
LSEKLDVPYLNAFPLLNEQRQPYAYLMYDGHFNENGNRLMAEAIYSWLFEQTPVPFERLR